MKIWESQHTFSHPWETVTQALWQKYPNPLNPHVVGVDVVDRRVTEEGRLFSERLMTTEWGLANWVKKLIGFEEHAYAHEISTVDPEQKMLFINSRNLTFDSKVSVEERISYAPHPEDPQGKTLMTQQATVIVQGVPLTSYMEQLMTSSIAGNASNGRQALESVILRVQSEAKDIKDTLNKFDTDLKTSLDDIIKEAPRPTNLWPTILEKVRVFAPQKETTKKKLKKKHNQNH